MNYCIDSQLPALSPEETIDRVSHRPGVCIPGHGFSRVSPSPAPSPRAISTTVHSMGRSRIWSIILESLHYPPGMPGLPGSTLMVSPG